MTLRFFISYILVNIFRILRNLFETLIPFFRKTSVIAAATLPYTSPQPSCTSFQAHPRLICAHKALLSCPLQRPRVFHLDGSEKRSQTVACLECQLCQAAGVGC